jgi:peptidyl-tRNA hydrolase, PTH1 family
MKLIVGLGNPGIIYKNTRHNLGYMVLDNYAKNLNLKFDKKKFKGSYIETVLNGEKVILLKPERYMNLSGEVINDFLNYYNISVDDMLIVHDDLDIEIGEIKLKPKGSSAGHNGLKNIEEHIKTREYKRLKIGISKVSGDRKNYVLGKLSNEEMFKIKEVIKQTTEIINDYLVLSFENLMNKHN